VISDALSALSSRTADACAGSGRHSPDETKRLYAAPTGHDESALPVDMRRDDVDGARPVPERRSAVEAARSARRAACGDIAPRLLDRFGVTRAGECAHRSSSGVVVAPDTSLGTFAKFVRREVVAGRFLA
jgi:hypothetical protein